MQWLLMEGIDMETPSNLSAAAQWFAELGAEYDVKALRVFTSGSTPLLAATTQPTSGSSTPYGLFITNPGATGNWTYQELSGVSAADITIDANADKIIVANTNGDILTANFNAIAAGNANWTTIDGISGFEMADAKNGERKHWLCGRKQR